MIIEQVEIREFGRLKNATYPLDERTQIIHGANESGKSTLAAFIRYMLYGFPRASGDVSEKKKRIGWAGGIAAGSMTVSLSDGKRYRIERVTTVATAAGGTRETYREAAQIIDLATGAPLPEGGTAGERFLGVPEEIFRATAFVGQLDSTRVGGSEVCEAMENILFSGDESISLPRALDRLDNLRRSLLHKNGKGGEIYELECEADRLHKRLAAAKERNSLILEKEAALDKIVKQIEAAERALTAATVEERNGHNCMLVASFDRLHEAEAQKKEAEEALRDMDGIPVYRLSENDLSDLHTHRRMLEDAERAYLAARARRESTGDSPLTESEMTKIAKMESLGGAAALSRSMRRNQRMSLVGMLVALLGLLTTGAGAVMTLLQMTPLAYLLLGVGAVVQVVGWALLLVFSRRLRALVAAFGATDAKALAAEIEALAAAALRLSAHRAERGAVTEEEQRTFSEYNRALGLLDTVVRRFGKPLPTEEIYDFLDELESAFRRVMEKKKHYEESYKSADRAIGMLLSYIAGADEAAVREALPADYSLSVDEINPEELRRRREFYTQQVRLLSDKRAEVEREVYAARTHAEDPVALEGDLAQVEERLAAAKDKHRAVVMAYEALAGAGERLREEIAPNLSRFSCRLVEHLTDGKYGRVGVDNNLALTVGTELGTTVPLDYMSAGTQDLAYLSLRMALIDLLYREKPPVCFDESFSHLDDTRAARMIELVQAMGEAGHQCLVFTCHKREEQLYRAAFGDVALLSL